MSKYVGLRYGKFTIQRDAGAQWECKCTCGRVELVNKAFTKPTYRGRRQCAMCAGHPCSVCDTIIPAKPGHRSATCSDACAKEHIKRRAHDYYLRVKDTPQYKAMHARAVQSFRDRMKGDPEFATIWRAYYREQNRLARAKINADPVERAKLLDHKRAHYRAWRLQIMSDPGGWEALKFKARAWYASLSDADKERIYINPAKARRHKSNSRISCTSSFDN